MIYEYKHFGISELFLKRYGSHLDFPKHLHQSYELLLVLSGEMDVWVGSEQYRLRAGEAVLVFPHQIHAIRCENCSHMLVIFSPEIVRAYDNGLAHRVPRRNRLTLPTHLIEQLHALDSDSSKVQMKATLYGICALMDEGAEYVTAREIEGSILFRAFAFVENHYDGDCSLERASRSLGISYSYLSRYFAQAVEMSFCSYVNRYRISRACYLLSNTQKTVLACAMECGYTSLRSFNRNFKLYTGKTPQEYRG